MFLVEKYEFGGFFSLLKLLSPLAAIPLGVIVYNVYFHALARHPGPLSHRISRLPHAKSLISGTLCQDLEQIHRQYGPIVRIAPNEISFATPEAWNDLFQGRLGHEKIDKDRVWWEPPAGQAETISHTLDRKTHARIRKALNPGFTPRAVKDQEPVVQKYAALLVQRLRELVDAGAEDKGAVVDISPWFSFISFDIVGDLGFGDSFDCLANSQHHEWIKMLFNTIKALVFMTATRFYPLLETILLKSLPKSLLEMRDKHNAFVADKIDRRINLEVDRPDFASSVIKSLGEEEGLSLNEMYSNYSTLAVAGSETTSTGLTAAFNLLCMHRDKLDCLVKEIRDSFEEDGDINSDSLQSLPYLDAVIYEALRLCPPVPLMVGRKIPAEGKVVCGKWYPGGTKVCLPIWALFRAPDCFYDAATFHPERWLKEATEEKSPFYNDKRDAFKPFSVGPAACLGRILAMLEMRLIIAKTLWTFDIEPAAAPLQWETLKNWFIWDRKPVEIRLTHRGTPKDQ